jgi:ribulose-5-phosphate 4-epimerase/fuculose-1-phosphate aldolase
LLFEEITASQLLKVDYQGRKMMQSPFSISPEANVIHGAVLVARPEVNCVAHVHTVAGTAIASRVEGLGNISQQSMIVAGSLAYHDYEGVVLDAEEAPRIVRDLGSARHMILRNHGLLTVGASVSLAFQALYNLQRSCEVQVAAEAGCERTIEISDAIMDRTMALFAQLGTQAEVAETPGETQPPPDLLWEALLRRLDRREPEFRD